MSPLNHLPPRRRGFTLIELLVALGISMLVVLVIAEVFLQTRRNYSVQDDQARVQENTRFVVQTVSRIVRQASFRSYPGVATTTYFPYASAPAISGVEGTGTLPDQISIRFQGSGDGSGSVTPPNKDPDNTIFDCLGGAYKFGVNGISTFALQTGGADGTGLFCTATDPTPTYAVGSTTWLELVPGVENMQILYGVDTDGDRTANVYLRASDISSVNQDQIVSARFSLLVRSPTEISPIANNTTYVMNGVTVGSNPSASASATPFTDRRIRRVVDFTVNLRNRTP